MKNQKGFSILVVVIIILSLVVIVLGGTLVYQSSIKNKKVVEQQEINKNEEVGQNKEEELKIVKCTSDWICSWGPCVNGVQQQYGYDANACDGGFNGAPIQMQTENCSPLIKPCFTSIPKTINIIRPVVGTIWEIGSTQTIEYSVAEPALNVDAFLVDDKGNRTPLLKGSYVDKVNAISKITFKLGTGDSSSVKTGNYWLELKTTNCGFGFCPYSQWGTNSAIRIVEGSTKSINLISPNGGENLKVGNTYDITWSAKGYIPGSGVTISIEENMGGVTAPCKYLVAIANPALNQGVYSYSWTIPSEYNCDNCMCGRTILSGEQFKITVVASGGDEQGVTSIRDESDNYFNIY